MIDVDDELDENVKDKIIDIIDLIVIAAHVICDDVKNVIDDVIKINV